MKSLARVIPTVVAHELKDMGELVDIDSDQVQEEIVSVVDEVHIYERVCNIYFCKPIMRVLLYVQPISSWLFFHVPLSASEHYCVASGTFFLFSFVFFVRGVFSGQALRIYHGHGKARSWQG